MSNGLPNMSRHFTLQVAKCEISCLWSVGISVNNRLPPHSYQFSQFSWRSFFSCTFPKSSVFRFFIFILFSIFLKNLLRKNKEENYTQVKKFYKKISKKIGLCITLKRLKLTNFWKAQTWLEKTFFYYNLIEKSYFLFVYLTVAKSYYSTTIFYVKI